MFFNKSTAFALLTTVALLTGCGNDDNTSKTLEEQVDYTIVGIEPGSGTMEKAYVALEDYENLKDWKLEESSTAGMLAELDKAIKNEKPVIVTGWNPHWMFSKYDLKYLEDPKKSFGEVEQINTIVRKGFKEDLPNAYTIVDRFYWEPEDMEEVMVDSQTSSFTEAASKWVENNADVVAEFTADVEKGNGEKIKVISTPWETEDASSHVLQAILQQHGFVVELTPVDPAIMFQAIATGEGDVSVAPWLPVTHQSFFEKHKDDIVDLGENLVGARIGLVVPAYMDIDSIEDLVAK